MTYLDIAKSILAQRQRVADWPASPDDLPAEWHYLWDERAAIMEFDGKMSREQAEAMALDDILAIIRRDQKR